MRINSPVTQRDYPFPKGETLVSTTDLQGRILYCNRAFIEVSGYEQQELLGQPHNMIRHPDMPEEAFRDMWATIQQGQPWSAAVKNRRKNGDHYWVMANVTPLIEASGSVTGYMSVRTEPDTATIAAAEALYRQMREGGSAAPRLHRGQVLDNTLSSRVRRSLRMGLGGRTTLMAGLIGAVGFLLGQWEAGGLSHIELSEAVRGLFTIGVCAAVGGWYLKGLVAAPLMKLVHFSNQIAGGNLTQTFNSDRNDEIGYLTRSLSQLNVNLMSIVRDARNGVLKMRQDTGVIAEGNQDLSARTESQASSLEQTASSMEQITATIRTSTDMAVQATDRAESARAVTERSGAAVNALSGTMQSISEASRKISEIIQVVDSIAFQTNILALNAAVEAARAGEQGRGFAVVAGEVRALAQRTTVAAREIRGLIQASVEQVAAGGTQTDNASAAMSEAQAAVNEVHQFIQQISQGMREQMLGVTQVNQAVAEMDSLTQQNAALVEEIAASASELRKQAGEVADSVSVFQLRGSGPSAPTVDAVQLRKAAKHATAGPAPAGTAKTSAPPRPAAPASVKRAPVRAPAPAPSRTPVAAGSDGDGDWDTF
ncbi:methyl-accepting chemotaxis protein, partial [Ideonella sp.]|uniref:methyl-accepting chemotaxis protein n=1 Tax=Ideonella sp. TaxID=1929293 RepID=UPI003BB79332